MNEQIQNLKDKIWTEEYWTNPNTDKLLQAMLEKFAELIVRECLGCCDQVISDPVPESVDTWLNGGSQCMAEIKQHFGVED
jgi:hypothetical protein